MHFGRQGLFGRITNRLREEFTVPDCDSATESGGERAKEDNRLLSVDRPYERPGGKAFQNTKHSSDI